MEQKEKAKSVDKADFGDWSVIMDAIFGTEQFLHKCWSQANSNIRKGTTRWIGMNQEAYWFNWTLCFICICVQWFVVIGYIFKDSRR